MLFKRIILITVDCLRADHVSCIGGGNLTPNIDKFAKDAIIFTRAFANGPGTNQSFPAILASTYFLIHGSLRLNPRCTTLAEVLRDYGFKTVAFHSNPFLSKVLGWNKGFDEFYDFMDTVKGPSAFITRQQTSLTGKLIRFFASLIGANRNSKIQKLLKKVYFKFSKLKIPYLEGKELNTHVINWIKKNLNEKFFLWMHYMDPHDPYIPPEEYLTNFSSRQEAFNFNLSVDMDNLSKEELDILKKLYENEVRYTDACIGEFLNFLGEKKLLEDSLTVITADHGHAFMEHGRFAHAYDILYNEVIHVPLIIYGLGKRIINSNVQLLDLSPTILNLLGIKSPPTFIGKSMFKIKGDFEAIFSESAKPDLINLRYDISKKVISCIKGKFKLIFNELKGTKELYDLKNDFQERNNFFDIKDDICKELLSEINRHLVNENIYKIKLNKISNKTRRNGQWKILRVS